MELISVFEPRDKAAMPEDIKKNFLAEFARKKSLAPNGGKDFCSGPPVWRPWRLCREPAKARQFLVFQTFFFIFICRCSVTWKV